MDNKLREARFFKRFTQIRLGRLTEINPTRISLLENGLVDIRPEEREKLASILEWEPDELFPEAK